MAFVSIAAPLQPLPLAQRVRAKNVQSRRLSTIACAGQAEQPPAASTGGDTSKGETLLLPAQTMDTLLEPTMLRGKPLSRMFSSTEHGFSHVSFFDRLAPMDGVPALVLGRTSSGTRFGGYTSFGFAARDDYRETSKPEGLFVFRVESDDTLCVAEPTDLVLYDFADYAVRFGAGLLAIPMNSARHVMSNDRGTSSCRMPDGSSSVFGRDTTAKLDVVEVYVASEYAEDKPQQKQAGLFGRLFG